MRSATPVGDVTDVPGAYRVHRVDGREVEAGRMWPQSRASQLAGLVVGSGDDDRVLRCLRRARSEDVDAPGAVTAVEVHPGRSRELAANVGRASATNVRVVNADVRELDERGFDWALVDAPCSGLGVLARRPDLRWRARPLPELQVDLLRAAAERTRPAAASSTRSHAERGRERGRRRRRRPRDRAARGGVAAVRAPEAPEFLLTTPHRHGTSGFFISRMRT